MPNEGSADFLGMEDVNFNWVEARSECNIEQMFERLSAAVDSDTRIRHAQPGSSRKFEFRGKRGEFFVRAEGHQFRSSVEFELHGNTIRITRDGKQWFEAAVKLDDDRVCRFYVGNDPLESWQLRRRALEKLFFEA